MRKGEARFRTKTRHSSSCFPWSLSAATGEPVEAIEFVLKRIMKQRGRRWRKGVTVNEATTALTELGFDWACRYQSAKLSKCWKTLPTRCLVVFRQHVVYKDGRTARDNRSWCGWNGVPWKDFRRVYGNYGVGHVITVGKFDG